MTEKTDSEVKYQTIGGAPWIMVLGAKGVGKTRLTSTMPELYCLDTEPPGAASAYPDDHRKAFQFNSDMYGTVEATVENLLKNTVKEGRVRKGKDIEISGVTMDTFDTLQKVLVTKYLEQKRKPNYIKAGEIWAPKMEQNDWGTILKYQAPLIFKLKELEIPVVWVCHSKISDPLYQGWGDQATLRKRGRMDMDVSGSIQNWIENLCDYILHIVINDDGSRAVITQPSVWQDSDVKAADRHNLFKNKDRDWTMFNLPVDENGFPKRQVIDFICKNHVY